MTSYKPMLARSAEEPFTSRDWIFEVKWDGIRAISYVGEDLSIKSRNHKELLSNFPELEELKQLAGGTVLDGEIILMRDGQADFQTLIERNQKTSIRDIEYMAKKYPATYVVFDILEKNNQPVINETLVERKRILKESVQEGAYVVLSLFVEETGVTYFQAALEKGVEGIMAKKKESQYEPGKRSENWLKIKKLKTCDCVIFGYTRGEGSRKKTFGSLVLGLYDNLKPVFMGKVGTGFTQQFMEDLIQKLDELQVEEKTLKGVDEDREVVWVQPHLVCEVGYQTLTSEGRLRIPVFKGLKEDKQPRECTIDQLGTPLKEYAAKRDFIKTPEPVSSGNETPGKSFVIHEHHARRLHYDLRLERDGVLKSWAVPKGPPESPGEKHLAVQVEDHPLEYGTFEGTIPEGQYGAGTVKIWDKGLYEPLVWGDNKIEILMKGERLEGRYVLVRFKKAGEHNWLFFKAGD
jgi:DNA ligase D-like protein (predicted ligase)/DNA ligase D-like protein (predicted 3'-phosphoesterase)